MHSRRANGAGLRGLSRRRASNPRNLRQGQSAVALATSSYSWVGESVTPGFGIPWSVRDFDCRGTEFLASTDRAAPCGRHLCVSLPQLASVVQKHRHQHVLHQLGGATLHESAWRRTMG
jgi:hypothetical protein